MNATLQPALVRRAHALAWFTILYNAVEGGVSVAFGVSEASIALLGFGVDSWIEVASAAVVLWRLRGELGGGRVDRDRERRATKVIAALFVLLGVGVMVGAVVQMSGQSHPATSVPGLVISALSLSFMLWLWRAKLAVAAGLDSRTLEMDAGCSRACLQLSGVLFAGSLLYLVNPAWWWADASAAVILALLFIREGAEGYQAANKPEFTGGCGCGH
ncbi:MAG: heavy metal transporter [Alphaproteobacteria bacterium]|nr:heavy metal transporter [Alphaproteobacteria bacterium]